MPDEGGVGGLVEKVKGLRSTNWQLQNSHEDVKYSIGDRVNSIVITMYGVKWVLVLWGDHFVSYINI